MNRTWCCQNLAHCMPLSLGNLAIATPIFGTDVQLAVLVHIRRCSHGELEVLRRPALVIALSTVSGAQAQTPPDAAAWLAAHNAARRAVGAGLPPLSWNNAAYQSALAWARNRAATPGCPFQHSPTTVYGENIAWSSSTTTTPTSAVGLWVGEKAYYNYGTNSCAKGKVCGHYTQVVWKATTSVGCASVTVPAWTCNGYKGGKFFTCNYSPAGNIIGRRPY